MTKEEFDELRVEIKDTFKKSADICRGVADQMREVSGLIVTLRNLETKLKDGYKSLHNEEKLN